MIKNIQLEKINKIVKSLTALNAYTHIVLVLNNIKKLNIEVNKDRTMLI